MRVSKERLARLALLWSEAVGPGGLARLVAHFGTAWQALHARREDLAVTSLRLNERQIALITTLPGRLDQFEEEWRTCSQYYIRVLFPGDEGYPEPLVRIPNAPAVLTMYGNWLPTDDPAVAIVGTRRPTPEGEAITRELAAACARRGLTVVSGLARGVDEAAHRAAVEEGGRTLAVVGCGLLAIESRRTGGLERLIAEKGAVLSELGPYSKTTVPHLMARNRLTSGLARAVLVVQSRQRGGALVTAEYARKQERLVLAVPWPEGLPEGEGTAALLASGAKPVSSADEIAQLGDDLHAAAGERRPPQQLPLFGGEL
ncbi:MAG: DNA-processing protein DprA [Armatimonadetes bacterium]|nr:DNA-processing protein DprA [Armatimonadota bacterium]